MALCSLSSALLHLQNLSPTKQAFPPCNSYPHQVLGGAAIPGMMMEDSFQPPCNLRNSTSYSHLTGKQMSKVVTWVINSAGQDHMLGVGLQSHTLGLSTILFPDPLGLGSRTRHLAWGRRWLLNGMGHSPDHAKWYLIHSEGSRCKMQFLPTSCEQCCHFQRGTCVHMLPLSTCSPLPGHRDPPVWPVTQVQNMGL